MTGEVYEWIAAEFHGHFQDYAARHPVPGHTPHPWDKADPAYRAAVTDAIWRLVADRVVLIGAKR